MNSNDHASESLEIRPGRFYTLEELREVLPPQLYRIVAARCQVIADLIIGQAVIHALSMEFLPCPSIGSSRDSELPGDLMTLREVADYLKVSEKKVRRLVEAGLLGAEDLRQPGDRKACLRFSHRQLERDRKRLETTKASAAVTPRFRVPTAERPRT